MNNFKVLIVDANKQLVEVMKSFLARENYQVKAAFDLNTAVKQVWNYHPDIIICNYHLADGTATDFYRNLNQLPNLPFCSHVLMFDYSDNFTEPFWKTLENDPITSFLFKPFTKAELLAVLDYNVKLLKAHKLSSIEATHAPANTYNSSYQVQLAF